MISEQERKRQERAKRFGLSMPEANPEGGEPEEALPTVLPSISVIKSYRSEIYSTMSIRQTTVLIEDRSRECWWTEDKL